MNEIDRWIMNRAVFYNYWYYPNQELIFKDGCAVLRGHNGSGKSVTTQSLITILLDGDVRSHKLDPFGGRERKISDTVLGEKELLGLNHRIGYIALEFKKGKSGVTKTIGMGIEADREKKQPKVWYFIINGKRIGNRERDLRLYTTETIDGEVRSIPRNEKDLRMTIEGKLQCGKVYNNRDEYASMVNKQLFGFENLESYKGLIDLLLQARSPKLSDQNKPEGAAYVLNDSLPQLTEEELRPLTSSIESINRLENDLITYKEDLKEIRKLHEVYQEYNEVAFTEKADSFLRAYKQYECTKKRLAEKRKKLEDSNTKLGSITKEIRQANDSLEVYKTEKADLGVEEIESVLSKKDSQLNQLKKQKERYESLLKKKEAAKQAHDVYKKKYEESEAKMLQTERELLGYMDELKETSTELSFPFHSQYFEHFSLNHKEDKDYDFRTWEQLLRNYRATINKAKREIEKYEQLRRDVTTLENTLGEIRMKIDEAQRRIDETDEEYQDELRHIGEKIAYWAKEATSLAVPREIVDGLLSNLDDIFDVIDKEKYLGELQKHVSDIGEKAQSEVLRLKMEISNETQTILSIQNEIIEWENEKEVEPDFVLTKKQDWDKLKQDKIPFQPFYEAFEFHKGIENEEQRIIQNVLYESGILLSVIVGKEDSERAASFASVLKYNQVKNKNLYQVLHAVENPEWNDVLKGISFEKHGDAYVLGDGTFQTSFVKGKASLYSGDVYIGKTARENFRMKKIEELQTLKGIHEDAKNGLEQNVNDFQKLKENIQSELGAFPILDSLKELLKDIESENDRIKNVYEPEAKEKKEKINLLTDESKDIMTAVKRMDLPIMRLEVDYLADEVIRIDGYAECLQDIQNSYKDRVTASDNIENFMEQAKIQSQLEQDHHSDMVDVELDIQKINKSIKGLNRRLEELGEQKILQRVEELSKLINDTIPNLLRQLYGDETETKRDITDFTNQIEAIEQNEIPFDKTVFEAWENLFHEQVRLGYVEFEENIVTLQEKAQNALTRLGHLIDKNRTKIEGVKKRLNQRFQKCAVDYQKYEPILDNTQSEHIPVYETQDDTKIQSINFIREQMSRIIVTLEIDEIRLSPKNVVDRLSKRIEDMERDANEKDRELYQEILINTLGDKIRRKIQYVEAWEKEMNKFMEHKNLIKFRIKWVPKDSEKPEEMNTRALVEALKKNTRWIDIDEISNHFRSKIKDAKRKYENEAEANLQQIMKEVLDYRSWFHFEIYFTKKGDKEKKLNRNTYGELSGGQRVLAMVTPVLAALYSKYMEGREDAPRIFTLDEAFARVDEESINVMFEYIYKLGFNYILNSQSLWGCFESVPSLNIYELSRPDNRPFVAIQSYYWNGNKRVTVDEAWMQREKEGEMVNVAT
ncbi:TIGR02680 family protein [Bacillus sp. B-jedd]|uniref:TIGR02680 family protein n=1 Tax=Bacillus sp. B-jedd TaxID=1476857 RepID=UPI001E31D94D|nr:TIGR02680 family protein [Bacillus sp. B-jedd]